MEPQLQRYGKSDSLQLHSPHDSGGKLPPYIPLSDDSEWGNDVQLVVHFDDTWLDRTSGVWVPARDVGNIRQLRQVLGRSLASKDIVCVVAVYVIESMHTAHSELHQLEKTGKAKAWVPQLWSDSFAGLACNAKMAVPLTHDQDADNLPVGSELVVKFDDGWHSPISGI
eukprot:1492887-Prymnesium_polylepis.1